MDEGHQCRDQTPGNHDPRDPAPGAPSFRDQCSGNLQQEIAEKENPSAHANHAFAETKVVGHLQRRRPHVHAIEKSDHVKQEQKGQEPPRDAMPRTAGHFELSTRSHGDFRIVDDRRHGSIPEPGIPCK